MNKINPLLVMAAGMMTESIDKLLSKGNRTRTVLSEEELAMKIKKRKEKQIKQANNLLKSKINNTLIGK